MSDLTPDEKPAESELPERFANAPLQLAAPVSFAERLDLREALLSGTVPLHRVAAAAIGLCWPRIRRKLPPYRGDVAVYGGLVLDGLAAEGAADGPEFWLVAGAAIRLCSNTGPSTGQVESHLGNSEGRTGRPT